ncbi:uncharacterized protein LOC111035111 [Myzus persicae]|uniref:uncharacterized protein LOC111035111 n=1 Tax=Myzus persicae TaxID=13164 RepID=UPI000B938044|nr:uncharacterized protein LOC111035111 [Myzus persicae]
MMPIVFYSESRTIGRRLQNRLRRAMVAWQPPTICSYAHYTTNRRCCSSLIADKRCTLDGMTKNIFFAVLGAPVWEDVRVSSAIMIRVAFTHLCRHTPSVIWLFRSSYRYLHSCHMDPSKVFSGLPLIIHSKERNKEFKVFTTD